MANKSEKSNNKQSMSVRTVYYFNQTLPILYFTIILIVVLISKTIIENKYPLASGKTLKTNKTTLENMKSTITSLNLSKKSYLEQKKFLEVDISNIRAKREAEGSLRFYTANLPAYGRYVEFRADGCNVEIISVEIREAENKVDYVVLGDYPNLLNFFNSLETREIYYIENFELLPSFNNSGSYVKFTANFNLDESITQRYEKKVKYEDSSSKTVIQDSVAPVNQPYNVETQLNESQSTLPLNEDSQSTSSHTTIPTSEEPQQTYQHSDTLIVEPVN